MLRRNLWYLKAKRVVESANMMTRQINTTVEASPPLLDSVFSATILSTFPAPVEFDVVDVVFIVVDDDEAVDDEDAAVVDDEDAVVVDDDEDEDEEDEDSELCDVVVDSDDDDVMFDKVVVAEFPVPIVVLSVVAQTVNVLLHTSWAISAKNIFLSLLSGCFFIFNLLKL